MPNLLSDSDWALIAEKYAMAEAASDNRADHERDILGSDESLMNARAEVRAALDELKDAARPLLDLIEESEGDERLYPENA